MNQHSDPQECPYVGLEPFDSLHAPYFFGRRQDSKIIADHVIARPIVVLYGASGVGKTSLLNVGLPEGLPGDVDPVKETEAPETADSRTRSKWTIVRLRDWQDQSNLERLAVKELVRQLPKPPVRHIERIRFDVLVARIARIRKRPVVLVLDQFEEYFRYRDPRRMRELEIAMGALITRKEFPLRVLVSLRDDALHELDQLRAIFPNLLDTTIRLSHLAHDAVVEAITKPIEQYNRDYRVSQSPVIVESDLVKELIRQLQDAEVGWGRGHSQVSDSRRIELPYLQLALTKIWNAEGGRIAATLTRHTLIRLGGVRRIIRDHVNSTMNSLPVSEQAICSKLFDRLVTSSGTKIAYPTIDLAAPEVVGASTKLAMVEAVLGKLTPKEARIVKPVTVNEQEGFEIFHDVLALPVLEWKRTFQLAAARRRRTAIVSAVISIVAGFAAVGLFAIPQLVNILVPRIAATGIPRIAAVYAIAVLGSLATEISALVPSVTTAWKGGKIRSSFLLVMGFRFAFALFASGPVAILLKPETQLAAFYVGLACPLLFEQLNGIGARAIKRAKR